jgi:hypothetical protein
MEDHNDDTPISVIRTLLADLEAVQTLAGNWYIGTTGQDDDLDDALSSAVFVVTKVLRRREQMLLNQESTKVAA